MEIIILTIIVFLYGMFSLIVLFFENKLDNKFDEMIGLEKRKGVE